MPFILPAIGKMGATPTPSVGAAGQLAGGGEEGGFERLTGVRTRIPGEIGATLNEPRHALSGGNMEIISPIDIRWHCLGNPRYI